MKQTGARPLLILATLTAIGILAVVVWAASQRSTSPAVHIGKAVSITRPHATAYTVGAAFRHFATAVASHYCGQPTSGVTWQGNVAEQHYAPDCTLRARYRILTPTPAPVSPTALPTAQPQPTPTPNTASPAQYALALVNQHRAQYGLAPLSMNDQQSVNALGHAQAEAATGGIWHTSTLYPQYSFPASIVVSFRTAGENTGDAAGSVTQAVQAIDSMMWSEPHSLGCSGSHACNMITAAYTSAGVGIYASGSITYYVFDFVGS